MAITIKCTYSCTYNNYVTGLGGMNLIEMYPTIDYTLLKINPTQGSLIGLLSKIDFTLKIFIQMTKLPETDCANVSRNHWTRIVSVTIN